ncbi:Transcriptional regulator PadR-like family protein [Halogranum gelatinilyticum]|jgi:DNA-binding PadR family transcriptional regulator|uniref:Transcriptional regulator PadR-like family protein n=1 Tax=Halogranum gelatinilyticum TaxID=660521 RepID=A0A1H0A3B7_9EURY|nr:Transcriptional regulator PadR-like family protein [Halogranum gelatinilyticum]
MLFDLTGFQRDLLYVISGLERPSGQEVKERFERDFGGEIKHGRLYPNLDHLVDNGYVEKGRLDRRTNYYQLTHLGRQKLDERRDWENQIQTGQATG